MIAVLFFFKDDQLEWRDRVYHAQSHCDRAQPDFPFAILNILPEKPVEVVRSQF